MIIKNLKELDGGGTRKWYSYRGGAGFRTGIYGFNFHLLLWCCGVELPLCFVLLLRSNTGALRWCWRLALLLLVGSRSRGFQYNVRAVVWACGFVFQ